MMKWRLLSLWWVPPTLVSCALTALAYALIRRKGGWAHFLGLQYEHIAAYASAYAGALAFIWLVAGYIQQGAQLRRQTEILDKQSDQIARQTELVTREAFLKLNELITDNLLMTNYEILRTMTILEKEGSHDLKYDLSILAERRRDGQYVSNSLLPYLDSNRRHVTVAILKAKARYIDTPFKTYCKYFETLLSEADRCGPNIDMRSFVEGTDFAVFYAVYSKMLGRESKLRRNDQALNDFLGPERTDQRL